MKKEHQMETIIEKIDENEIDDTIILKAAKILQNGGLVAFPTETVYGLGGNALNPEASGKIYEAKGRPSDNPLIVHISKIEDLYELARVVPDSALALAKRFWPGPLTMILEKKENVPDTITGGLSSVAIRMPENKIALKLIEKSGVYVAAPSANLSGRPSPTSASHVKRDLDGRIDMIIDGGEVNVGIESTIVDLTEAVPTILRPGYITLSDIEECLGSAQFDKGISGDLSAGVVPKAPGMKYKHYAPKGELTIICGDEKKVITKIKELTMQMKNQGYKVGIMANSCNVSGYEDVLVKDLGRNSTEAAQKLYGYLREFDDEGIDYIYSESFDDNDVGTAVMNRMIKAAGHKVIQV